MATQLQLRWIRIRTEQGWQKPYDLDAPVVAIVGVVDTGKSSLLDCIGYAMGHDVGEFRGAVDEHLREVEIGIRVTTGSFLLRRDRAAESHVQVLDDSGTAVGRFPVHARDARSTASEWLLEQLGLLEQFTSVRLPGGKSLDFAGALLPYCYLNQTDIDRHIIRPRREERARLITLKLLFNLTTPAYERLAAEIHENNLEIDRRTKRADMIRNFLAESQATDAAAIAEELARVRAARTEAETSLASITAAARTATAYVDRERKRREEAHRAVGDAEIDLDRLRRAHASCAAEADTARQGLRHLDELSDTDPDDRPTLALVDPRCPACNSDVTTRPITPEQCYLCTSMLPGREHVSQRRHLTHVLQQQSERLAELDMQLRVAQDTARNARARLRLVNDTLDKQAFTGLAPFVDRLAEATAEVARHATAEETLRRVQDAHNRLTEQYRGIDELRTRQQQRVDQLDLTGAEVEDLADVLAAVTDIFRRIIAAIQLPNATGRARIDPETWLPLVDEQKFTQRGGGARAAVSIAYSLTLLTYALENALVTLPSLLMIDSPQKNYGANSHDKSLAHRVYERFLDLMDDRRGWGDKRFARPYQVIIVDNDIHKDIADRILVHTFDRDNGFIRDLAEPHGPIVDPEDVWEE
ncbi:MAG: hypothetical protein HOV94_32650 [Saccharothrix sp.]|nr:hypothetical protein [Saccharothrix sp.]